MEQFEHLRMTVGILVFVIYLLGIAVGTQFKSAWQFPVLIFFTMLVLAGGLLYFDIQLARLIPHA